jgi:osmotically-inducible protein OsmY
VSKGVVTLRGVVSSLTAKRAAEDDARNTTGVADVQNLLSVRPRRAHDDTILRRNVLAALSRSPHLDAASLDAGVKNDRVTLYGTVGSMRDLRQAEKIAGGVSGVVDVQTDVIVTDGPDALRDDAAVQRAIERRLWANPHVCAQQVSVDVTRGVVTLTGTVPGPRGRDAALRIARSVWPDRVVDQLSVNNPEKDRQKREIRGGTAQVGAKIVD